MEVEPVFDANEMFATIFRRGKVEAAIKREPRLQRLQTKIDTARSTRTPPTPTQL